MRREWEEITKCAIYRTLMDNIISKEITMTNFETIQASYACDEGCNNLIIYLQHPLSHSKHMYM